MSERSSAQANTPTSANMPYGYPGHFDLMNMPPMQNPTDIYSYYPTNVYPAAFPGFDEHNPWATADTPGNIPPPGSMQYHQIYTPSPLDIPRAPFEYPPAPHPYTHYLPSYTPSNFPGAPSTATSGFDMPWNPHNLTMPPMPVPPPQPQLTPIGGALNSTKKPSAYDEYQTAGVGDMLAQHMSSVDLGGNSNNEDTHRPYDNGNNDPTTMLAAKEQQQQQQQQQQAQHYSTSSSNLSLSSRPTQAPPPPSSSSASNGPKSYASVVSADTLNSNSNKSTPSVSNVPVRSTIQSTSNTEQNPMPSNFPTDMNNNPRSNVHQRGSNHPHSINHYNQSNRNGGSAGYNPRYHQQQSSASGGNFSSWNATNSPSNHRGGNNHQNQSSDYYHGGLSSDYDRSFYSQQQTLSSPNPHSNRRANSNYQQNYPTARTNNDNINNLSNGNSSNAATSTQPSLPAASQETLEALKRNHQYNPKDFNLNPKGARFFVIKSYSEDDVHRSIKYNIWCSTEHGNKRLDAAFREREGKGPVYLFFSVNASGHFCGMAEMMSPVDYEHKTDVWQNSSKWQGKFEVKWIYVKDVPNQQFRHIRLENNDNKPVTNSRDTQEIPYEKGKLMLKTMHMYRDKTSIFDDFQYYESKQAQEGSKKPLHNDFHPNTPRGANNKRQYTSNRTSAMQHEQEQYQHDNIQGYT